MILQGKVALVTGAGRGIGRATAIALAEAGASVALNDLPTSPDADEALAAVRGTGAEAIVLPGDVGDCATVDRLVADTVARFGRLDIAVACAVYADRDWFHELDLDGFNKTIQITMFGAFYTLRAATRRMIEQGEGGSIVIIGSPHAVIAVPRSMPYNMAKAAVDHMARTAAIELVDHRIRVNVVHPGWTDTPGERKFATEEQIQRAGAKLPWKRMCRPDEIGRGVVFLCDPASDYITGSSLSIDGGSTLPWWASRGSAVPD